MLTKKDLEKLAGLARMDLKPKEEEKLLKDLGKILDYFEELKEVNTENVEPLTGGTESQNVLRDDELNLILDKGPAIEAFPENSGGFLKVPPVF
jgi:aspartyl-tRNA(Asn)/glutamyl-tRNA(Gln) amidotransferase subunit C